MACLRQLLCSYLSGEGKINPPEDRAAIRYKSPVRLIVNFRGVMFYTFFTFL
jgi:hypothetical protein